jgi:hypothetical protein
MIMKGGKALNVPRSPAQTPPARSCRALSEPSVGRVKPPITPGQMCVVSVMLSRA